MDEHLVSSLRPASFEAEQVTVCSHLVETLRRDAKLRRHRVTSPGVGEGRRRPRSISRGRSHRRPIPRSSSSRTFGGRPWRVRWVFPRPRRRLADRAQGPGALAGRRRRASAQVQSSVLAAGGPLAAPYEALKSPKFEALIEEAASATTRRDRHASLRAGAGRRVIANGVGRVPHRGDRAPDARGCWRRPSP